MDHAPIIAFAYKRPQHLRRMLDDLQQNAGVEASTLYIFCDGHKPKATAQDREAIAEVRREARRPRPFATVEVVEAPENKGLARSVIEGVSHVIARHGRAIIVEEDTRLSPHFLSFMNTALERYADNDKVFGVGAWSYFIGPQQSPGTFFLRYPDSQAWATWERSWDRFELDGRKLLEELRNRQRLERLDADGRLVHFSHMLKDQVKGRIDSWAIRWTANCILQDGVCLFPVPSLVRNAGIGEGATHEHAGADHNQGLPLATTEVPVPLMEPRETPWAFEAWLAYNKRLFGGPEHPTLKDRLWRVLPAGMRRWYQRLGRHTRR